MRKLLYLFLSFSSPQVFSQTTFQKAFGGTNFEFCWNLRPTTDGGYIIVGNTSSFGLSNSNIYLIKINNYGDTIWTKTYGGNLSESGLCVYQTNDGGYIISGGTHSFGAGNSDAYLVKTDSNGNLLWSKTYGGIYNEDIVTVQPTLDGGYILLGSTASFGTSASDFDVYLIKTNIIGDTLWTKTYGGTGSDNAFCLQQTADSGFVITGYSNSFGVGQDDAFLMKTDDNGNLLWTKTFGGVESDVGSFVLQTNDGGYIITGKTHSFGAFSNDGDLLVIRTNNSGDTLWTKTFGGAGTDWGYSVQQTSDGGFIVTGETWSFGAGQNDVYLLKTDSNGNLIWSKTFGGNSFDYGRAAHQTSDGGFIVACYATSFGAGSADFYLIKTDSIGNSGCNESNAVTITTMPATQITSPAISTFIATSVVTVPATVDGSGCTITSLCNNVGINEIAIYNSLLIYPNPFYTQSNLRTNILLKDATLTIYNSAGQEIKQIKNIAGQTITLHRDNLPSGLYFVRLSQDNKVIATDKLVITDK